jgi:hypothetical protein
MITLEVFKIVLSEIRTERGGAISVCARHGRAIIRSLTRREQTEKFSIHEGRLDLSQDTEVGTNQVLQLNHPKAVR